MTRVSGSAFRPAWWLPGPHLQTLWGAFFRRRPRLALEQERLELDDGDFIDLMWRRQDAPRPLVLILHGLEGSIRSHYAAGLVRRLDREGFDVCFMHFRGCSGEPNRFDRSYHSGDTGDLRQVVDHIWRLGYRLRGAVGFSLGGNVLLKWLGEQGEDVIVERAAAISAPYRLADAARRMNEGFSRFYQRHLVSRLRRKYLEKFSDRPSPLDVDVRGLKTFFQFDDQVTAPLHGFAGVDDYYSRSSSRQFLPGIRVPTLLIHAADDPFMYPETPPTPEELPDNVRLECSAHGGHVGFVAGRVPLFPRYWVEDRLVAWLRDETATVSPSSNTRPDTARAAPAPKDRLPGVVRRPGGRLSCVRVP